MPNQQSKLLVVGSLAYDSIETPAGSVERTLGGSANYFSLAASLFTQVRVVGVVGEDYADSDYQLLKSRGVELEGVTKVPGKTFFWKGKYEGDLNEAKTLKTDLNVFEIFNPQLPKTYVDSDFVFLANIDPVLQLQVLEQIQKPKYVGMDTMNFWISSKKQDLLKTVSKVDIILMNETEAMDLTGAENGISAAQRITEMGPSSVVIKRGEYGFVLYSKNEGFFILPAMPMGHVVDPTGAGDTFAGGFWGYLSSQGRRPTFHDLKLACLHGTVTASFTIQDFGVGKIKNVTKQDFDKRRQEYEKVVSFA
ncbi:MAG: PfkB family carbohydrate kinase [Bdellovibrionota bacterium]